MENTEAGHFESKISGGVDNDRKKSELSNRDLLQSLNEFSVATAINGEHDGNQAKSLDKNWSNECR